MTFTKYTINDNELLYLIGEGNEEALELMFKKYEPLIYKKIQSFKVPLSLKEDYFQEACLILHKAINTYDLNSEKTFNRYFDLILTNHFITLLRKRQRHDNATILVEESSIDYNRQYEESRPSVLDIDLPKMSHLEKHIFDMRYVKEMPIDMIANQLNIDTKKVYNTIQRIKNKIKKSNY